MINLFNINLFNMWPYTNNHN